MVNVAPQIGYDFSRYLNAGAGFSYSYFKEKHGEYRETNNYLGFNLYAKVYPLPYIVLMAQPEISRMWQTLEQRTTNIKTKEEKFVPICLVGAGLRLGPVTAMLQYDVAQNDRSPYGNRIFYSVGYSFGF